MMPGMSEEEIGEVKDELNEYKKQIDALRRDMEVVVKYSASLRNAVLSVASQSAFSDFGPEITSCQEFRDKYQIV
jgi:prefoldin subunit 5